MEHISERLVFVYSTLLRGERDHAALSNATFVGHDRTKEGYRLVEVGAQGALIASPKGVVEGELYQVDSSGLRGLDVLRENTRLYHRRVVQLESGREAEAYFMNDDQVVGRRRLSAGNWRLRFMPVSARRRSYR